MKEILGNGLDTIVSQALQKMKEAQGESFRIETVNLAALQRLTSFSRGRLRKWKRNLLSPEQCSRKKMSILSDYTSVLDHLLSSGISNTVICFERLKQLGYTGVQSADSVGRFCGAKRTRCGASGLISYYNSSALLYYSPPA